MTSRIPRGAVRTALLVLVACHGDKPAENRATDDPWNAPRKSSSPEPPSKPKPPRPLSMDGTIEAPAELLATSLPGYAEPKVGDWRAFRHITSGELGTFHATAIAEVLAVDASTVTIELRGRLDETGEQRSDGSDIFPRTFTVAHEIHRQHGNWAASKIALTEEPLEIAKRSFATKKVSASFIDPMFPNKEVRVEVWLSPEVPAGGEVAQREVQKMPAMTITSTSDLIGFGDISHTTWGTRPQGL